MTEKKIELKIFNSKTTKLEKFIPINRDNITMYVCGPTVYDRPHLGNVRSAVIYDILGRFLQSLYGSLTYVRNITDIDDKIIAAATGNKIAITDLTKSMIEYYHADIGELGCLPPTNEPKATDHLPEILRMIDRLIANGNAYISQEHVLFDVSTYKDYGKLSNRTLDEMVAGSRIEIASYKKNDMDFVLWKPVDTKSGNSVPKGSAFESPWGLGRPGWHIECSAMSTAILGDNFDIHGGGVDLIFPHHENEVAQSCCANPESKFANYWIHNGFLTVNGQKMSKSLNNFHTVHQVIANGISGMALRYFYLTTHYRKPIDYSTTAIQVAKNAIAKFAKTLQTIDNSLITKLCDGFYESFSNRVGEMMPNCNKYTHKAMELLANDLNTASVLAYLHQLNSEITNDQQQNPKIDENSQQKFKQHQFITTLKLIGLDPIKLLNLEPTDLDEAIPEEAKLLANQRNHARKQKDWQTSDQLRNQLNEIGFIVEDVGDEYVLRKKKK